MNKPRAAPGSCPLYDHPSNKCYLSETTPSSGTRDQKCNYEAWAKGSNYRNK